MWCVSRDYLKQEALYILVMCVDVSGGQRMQNSIDRTASEIEVE